MSGALPYVSIVFLLLGSAFFSGTEIAYTSLNKVKMKTISENPTKIWKLVSFIYNHYDYALSTVLVGNNLVNIGATTVATVIALNLSAKTALTEEAASTLVTVIMTIVILIVGEITPKMIARRINEPFAKMAAYPVMVLMILFFPVVWFTSVIVKLLSCVWRKNEKNVTITEEELENLLDTAEDEGVIDENETELLQSALEFTDLDAGDILTPRIDVVGIEVGDSVAHVLETVCETQFSRFPVYEGTIDHVVGILYVKQFLKEAVENPNLDVRDLLLPASYIHKSMHLPEIMQEFRKSGTHMAIVADEYGGITGIVTMEDVLEQLVGEIWDENDDIVNEWQPLEKGRFECSGDMNLSDFFDRLRLDEESLETDCATVGGWATENIGAMPQPFDSFNHQDHTILVKQVEDNRVVRLLVIAHHSEEELSVLEK